MTQQLLSVKPQDNILAFECIGQGFSLCFGKQTGEEHCFRSVDGFSAKHQLIQVMQETQVEFGKPAALACAIGPGSFTGLRVATVAARSVGWALNIPVFGVNSLLALAVAQGLGKWTCLLPLKKDTTFVAVYEIDETGARCLYSCQAVLDIDIPLLPINETFTAIGPALESKPDLCAHWKLPGKRGSALPITARDILKATTQTPLQEWSEILPAYFQASAPELQRQAQL